MSEQHDVPPHRRNRIVVGAVTAVVFLLVAIVIFIPQLMRPSGSNESTSTSFSDQQQPTAPPSSTIGTQDEVVARLHEIFRVRDRAIKARNQALLESIYTADCPCLDGDKRLIQRLKKEKLLWRSIEVSLDIEEAEQVTDRLWTINALVRTSPFEIVKESGDVVKKIPQGQELSRFALAKPRGTEEWLLGQASVIEERD